MPQRRPLTRDRDFLLVMTGEGITAVGDAVSFTALPLLVLALTGSGLMMGIVGALQTLPDLLFGVVAGAIADRSDRKRLLVWSVFGRGALTGLIPLSVVLGGPTMAVILVVAAPLSALRAFSLAAYTAAVPAIAERDRLGEANGYLEAVYSGGFVLGPAIAGLLSALIGPGLTLAVDAASFLADAVLLSFIARDLRVAASSPSAGLREQIREGVAYLVGHPVLRAAVALFATAGVVGAGIVSALTVHITRDLGESAGSLGAVYSIFGIGTVVGALVALRLRHAPAWPALLGGNLLRGLALVGIAVLPTAAALAPFAFLAGAANSLVVTLYITLRTALTPDELLGRVGSTARTVSLGLQPLGMLAAGALIDATDGTTTVLVIGLALVATTILFLPLRAPRGVRVGSR